MIYDRDHYRERCSIYAILTIIFFALLVLVLPEQAFPTTVTGVVKVQGQPLTGFVDVSLVYPATTGSYIALPGSAGHLPVTNGSFDALTLEGNDTLLPRGTYYQFLFSDAYGTGIARLNYVITGATFDIGTAVPTPVTTNNVNFLDLIGIRNLTTTNLTVLGNFNIGSGGSSLTADGIVGAKQVNGYRYAASYATGSATCGIFEAQAALPASGGTIYLGPGSCTFTSTIYLTKNVALIGSSVGATTLVNQTGVDGISVSTTAQLSNFTVSGTNVGGNGIDVYSPSTQVIGASITNVKVTAQGGAGIFVGDNVNGLSLRSVWTTANVGPGINVNGNTVGPVGVSIRDSISTLNGADGVVVTGGQARDISISNSVIASNTGNGANVTSGAPNSTLHILSSSITDNHQSGVVFAAGSGHTIDASTIQAGAHQLVGVSLNYSSAANITQLEVRDSTITTNLTNDLSIGASATGVVIYPLSVALSAMNNSINVAAGVKYVVAGPLATPKFADLIVTTGLCTTGVTAYATCTSGPYTWPNGGFADALYTATCTPLTPSVGLSGMVYVTSKTPTTFSLVIQNGTSSGAVATTFGEIDCHGSSTH